MADKRIISLLIAFSLVACGDHGGHDKNAHRAAECVADTLTISNAWIRESRPGARSTAAFMEICNGGGDVALSGATFVHADVAELHISQTDENAIATMRKLNELEIAAGTQAKLAPGGVHLMLISLKPEIATEENPVIELTFSDGQVIEAPFEFKSAAPGGHSHH